jgi:hypothetical protein
MFKNERVEKYLDRDALRKIDAGVSRAESKAGGLLPIYQGEI